MVNPAQENLDRDPLGDACDDDTDGDGVADLRDNCRRVYNPMQRDFDLDGMGDSCDSDDDGDGTSDSEDNCPDATNVSQGDEDGDGRGDVCDPPDLRLLTDAGDVPVSRELSGGGCAMGGVPIVHFGWAFVVALLVLHRRRRSAI